MSALDRLAERMFGRQRLETTAAMASVDTQTYIGVATSDSADGSVSVVLSDDVTQPDNGIWDGDTFLASDELGTSVKLPTTTAVKKGDRVLVTASGANVLTAPVVTGVVGRGDEQQAQIDAVSEGVEDVAAEVEQVRQDVADFRDDVATTYATKVEREDGDDAVKTWVTTNYTNSNDLATTYATKTLVSQTKDAIELAASQTYETQSDASTTYATKAALTVGLDGIRSEVAEDYLKQSDASTTYATKTEVQQTASGLDTRITTAQSTADGAYLERSGTGTTIDTTGAATIRSLVVEGQSVQDGTPTPSAPVAIQSVEGRNLLDVGSDASATNSATHITTTRTDGVYRLTGTAATTGGRLDAIYRQTFVTLPAGTYTMSQITSGTGSYNAFVQSSTGTILSAGLSQAGTAVTFTIAAQTDVFVGINVTDNGGTYDRTVAFQIEYGSTAHPYQPYGCVTLVAGSTRTDIDLQGHALRSLPDGTHDEMAVDSLGRVTMTQRVGVAVIDGVNVKASGYTNYSPNIRADITTLPDQKTVPAGSERLNAYADKFSVNALPVNNPSLSTAEYTFELYSNYSFAVIPISALSAVSTAAINAWLASNPTTVLYPLATPQTIDLGTIDLPEPADTLWLDAAIVPTIGATWWTVDGIAGQQALDAEVTERQTLIRQFSGGVLAGYVGNSVTALMNAAGSFDVVQTTWSDGTPTVTDTLASFDSQEINIGPLRISTIQSGGGSPAGFVYADPVAIGSYIDSSSGEVMGGFWSESTEPSIVGKSLTLMPVELASGVPKPGTPATFDMDNVITALRKANSLTPTPFALWAGSKIVNVGTSAVSTFTLFTKAQLQAIVGTSWTPTGANCAVFVMNGDYGATDAMMSASINSSSIVRVHMNKTRTGDTRINYLIIRFGA